MNVNLKLLSVFVVVAEHNGFRKAAEELDRSQSAVSNQIRQLEEQLGVELFHRTTRSVTLSREGEQLLVYVRAAIGRIESGVQAILETAAARRGRVVFACAPAIADARLGAILSAFKRQVPSAIVQVRELASEDLLDSIQAQEVDFGIGPRFKREIEFHFRRILTDDVWAVVPIDAAVDDARGITLAELSRFPMLMVTKTSALRSGLERALNDQHLGFVPQYEGGLVQTILAMVEAGQGAAILPRATIPPAEGSGYRALPVLPSMSREICIITLAGKTLSLTATQFIAVAERVLRAEAVAD